MVWKLKDPMRWMMLPQGEILSFEGEGVRPVRLEVNAVADASFTAVYPNGEARHLAAFKGIDTIEFVADGPVEVWVTSESDVLFYTDEGRNVAYVDDGQVSFTVPHDRGSQTDQLIYMQGLMLRNMERRNAELEEIVIMAREANREDRSGHGEGELPESESEPPVSEPSDAGTSGVAEPEPNA